MLETNSATSPSVFSNYTHVPTQLHKGHEKQPELVRIGRLLGGLVLSETFSPSQHLLSPMHPLGAADVHVHPSW